MALRDEILKELEWFEVNHDDHNAADGIMAAIREALLSEVAVEAGSSVLFDTSEERAEARNLCMEAISATLAAALDAALGDVP